MNLENYFLPHMGHAVAFPRPHPLLAVVVQNYVSPISLHVKASSIQRYLFEDFGCCASILPGPLPWLATEVAITPFPLSLFCKVSYIISTLLEILSMVSYIAFSSSIAACSIVHACNSHPRKDLSDTT